MNIMLTCVGRRNYLVEYFKDALSPDGKVIGVNSIENTSGMMAADIAIVSPAVNSENYIDFLLEVSSKYDVNAIFSLFDIDLKFLAKAKKRFEQKGIILVISSEDVISICNDKYQSYLWLKENHFNVPKTYLSINEALQEINENRLNFPVIVKPRFGMGSIATFKAEDNQELRFFFEYVKKLVSETYLSILTELAVQDMVIIQEFIDGQEYGIDILNDLNGRFVTAVTKKKLAMRSGETDSAEIFKSREITIVSTDISEKLKHIGNLDIDLLMSKSGIPYIIDMNPRFGGGYPFTHEAGYNYIEYLLNAMSKPDYHETSDLIGNCNSKKYIGCKGIKMFGRFI